MGKIAFILRIERSDISIDCYSNRCSQQHCLTLIPTITLKMKCGHCLWRAWSDFGTYCFSEDEVCMSLQVYVALRSLSECQILLILQSSTVFHKI